MHRRFFLTSAAAAVLVPAAVSARFVDYTDADPIQQALDAGKTVFVDYSAKWCGTCARQARVLDALFNENPAYAQNVVFVKVDWDTYKSSPVTRSRNIPRRSTLIVLKGEQELGRLVAETSKSQIRALMDVALNAATSA